MEEQIIKFLYENYSSKNEDERNLVNKYKKKYTPDDILSAREIRVNKQDEWMNKYRTTLICMRVNYPGVEKNNYVTLGIMKVLCDELFKIFKQDILFYDCDITAEGPIFTMIIDRLLEDAKRKAINLEESHFLGRCVDIDVYGKDGQGISRRELGLKERKCFICQEPAKYCVRQTTHDSKEIKSFIRNKYEDYLESRQNGEKNFRRMSWIKIIL